ncbi:MAG: zinc ribbon domain-containing protein [Treponema sp.]|jgi:putative FmdB family regulatory protein|nr:zinc ribbon domain-containing protein [Treponema sp.]
MPTYEYECKSCGYSFEAFQSMRDDPLKECPECGKEIRRLINGGSGVIFKGSGFYVTDKKAGSSSGKNPKKPDEKKADSACSSCPAGGASGSSACPAAGASSAGKDSASSGNGSSSKAAG